MSNLFDAFGPVIHSYGDDQAVKDGVLVDLPAIGCNVVFHGRTVDRMTGALYGDLKPFVEASAVYGSLGASLAHMLQTKLAAAVDTAAPGEERDVLYSLPSGEGPIWLMRNERDAWTVMWPSDY